MYTEEQLKPYIKDLEKMPPDESLIYYLEKTKHTENFEVLVEYCCNIFLDGIQRMFLKYDKYFEEYKNKQPKETNFIKLYLRAIEFLDKDKFPYYFAVAEFFKGNHKKTIEYLKKNNRNKEAAEYEFTILDFANSYVAPFKEAFDGFWEEIYNMLAARTIENGVLELCKAMPLFYSSTDAAESCAALEKVLTLAPDSSFVKEILAINYYNAKMWGNAVALLEQTEDELLLMFEDNKYFMMGYCYNKLKETSNEIAAYEKAAEIYPEGSFIMNNLGYAYYRAKQYNKALECFQRCIDNNWDLDYAVNNYVRTLLTMRRFKDAKDFAKNPPYKINKTLLEKVKNADNTNRRISADKPIVEPDHEELDAIAVLV